MNQLVRYYNINITSLAASIEVQFMAHQDFATEKAWKITVVNQEEL